jgi:hypothetical protein
MRRRMKQRPDAFILNKTHQLNKGLIFAGLGSSPGGSLFRELSDFRTDLLLTNMTPTTSWVYDVSLQRRMLYFTGGSTQKVDALCLGYTSIFPRLRTNPWTISVWLRASTFPHLACVFGFGAQMPISTDYVERYIIRNNNHYYLWGGSADWDTGIAVDTDNIAHHIAVVSNGSKYYFYRDGIELANGNVHTSQTASAGYITFGSHHSNGSAQVIGSIGDGCIYSRALSVGEINVFSDPSNVDYDGWIVPILRPYVFGINFPASGAVDVTVTPSTLNAISSIQSFTEEIDCTVTPSTLNVVVSLQSLIEVIDFTSITVSLDAVTSLQSPVIKIDCTVTPSTLDVVSSIQSYAEEIDCTIVVSVLSTTATLLSPIVVLPVAGQMIAKIQQRGSRRADRFELDVKHPLSEGLVFAALGQYADGPVVYDSSLYKGQYALQNIAEGYGWQWDEELHRYVIRFDAVDDEVNILDINNRFNRCGTFTSLVKKRVHQPNDGFDGSWGIGQNIYGVTLASHYPNSDTTIYDATFSTIRKSASQGVITDRTKWHRVTITADEQNNNWKFYQNNTIIQDTILNGFVLDTPIVFGRSTIVYYGTYWYDGWMTDICFYNRILSEGEITILSDLSNFTYNDWIQSTVGYVAGISLLHDIIVTPDVLVANANLQSLSEIVDCIVHPNVLNAVASIQSTIEQIDCTVVITTLNVNAALQVSVEAIGVPVTVIDVDVELLDPSIHISCTVTPNVLNASIFLLEPIEIAPVNITITVTELNVVAVLNAPFISTALYGYEMDLGWTVQNEQLDWTIPDEQLHYTSNTR